MKLKNYLLLILALFNLLPVYSQKEDSVALDYIPSQEALYSRPFITKVDFPSASIGGYCEANTNYFSTDGVSEGISFELRRFNLFIFELRTHRKRTGCMM